MSAAMRTISAAVAGYGMMWRAIDRHSVLGRIQANGWVRLLREAEPCVIARPDPVLFLRVN